MSLKVANDDITHILELKKAVENYIEERNWEAYQHPKELAVTLAIEVAELMELFQWDERKPVNEIASDEKKVAEMREEIADIMIYLLSFCNQMEIDLSSSVMDKIKKIKKKYPVDKVISEGVYRKDGLDK